MDEYGEFSYFYQGLGQNRDKLTKRKLHTKY